MKRMDNSCKNMNVIIDDILDLSKLDNDEMMINMEEHSIDDIVTTVYEEYEPIAKAKGLYIEYAISKDVPELLYTDDTRIYQILSNLVSNSIKYSNTGMIKISIFYEKDDKYICFEIKDEGKGIRKEEMNNLFKDYGRTSNCTPNINSNGLGLSVCQKIANFIGGSIKVNSEYNKGSTFTFMHPIDINKFTQDDRIDNRIDNNIDKHNNISNINNAGQIKKIIDNKALQSLRGDILIVDDDVNITALFKLMIKWINCDYGSELSLDVASNSTHFSKLTNTKKYDLILMDIDLDGEDGCWLCSDIKYDKAKSQINNNTPIVAITANIKTIQKDRDSRYDCFDEILLKPFTNKDIVRVIEKYMSTV
jgi:CheY-like chemotaxis protein